MEKVVQANLLAGKFFITTEKGNLIQLSNIDEFVNIVKEGFVEMAMPDGCSLCKGEIEKKAYHQDATLKIDGYDLEIHDKSGEKRELIFKIDYCPMCGKHLGDKNI